MEIVVIEFFYNFCFSISLTLIDDLESDQKLEILTLRCVRKCVTSVNEPLGRENRVE